MLEGTRVVDRLSEARSDGASRDELLRSAVREMEEAEDHFDWVGIYLLEDDDELVLHNYIGRPTDHDRIPVGKGVCGEAVAAGRDINVPDVRERENYLACSAETRSELVVLIRDPGNGEIHGQVDLDSDDPDAFDERDEREVRVVADWLAELF